jgi:hypothetical protein
MASAASARLLNHLRPCVQGKDLANIQELSV